MLRISIVIYLFLTAGCSSNATKDDSDFSKTKFDTQVIEKLPAYDSLVYTILENYPSFLPHIKEDESYRAYRYMALTDSNELFKKLPREQAVKINQYFTQLGQRFIFGFDLFRDSSIKIYVRTRFSQNDQADIWENLSFYPSGTNIKRREPPAKDTILNKNWQYWIAFSGRDPFG